MPDRNRIYISHYRLLSYTVNIFATLHQKVHNSHWVREERDSMHETLRHGPLARCVKLRAAHAPGMPGTFSPPPRVSDPDMHHGTCVTHVPWWISGSLTSGFLWSRWRGKRSRHSRRMRNPQFYVSGKRPMAMSLNGNAFASMVISVGNLPITIALPSQRANNADDDCIPDTLSKLFSMKSGRLKAHMASV